RQDRKPKARNSSPAKQDTTECHKFSSQNAGRFFDAQAGLHDVRIGSQRCLSHRPPLSLC
ncbi:hypothetical protein, partial [Mangrovicoccus sp. HB161399]|uniref:hypothetical protein n=1 Tax=Mangrovicoccus sp. HB161399 TaxID=2720392 RepID=UPI001C131DBD